MKNVWFLVGLTVAGQLAAQNNRFFAETALRLSADAEMVFIGPALAAGAGVNLGKYLSASASYTFYYSRISGPETLVTHTLDLLPVFQFQSPFHKNKGIYLGAGPAWQHRKQSPEMVSRSAYRLAAFTIGYRFPLAAFGKPRVAAIDLKGFGPYTERDVNGTYTEVLTQVMLGMRLRF